MQRFETIKYQASVFIIFLLISPVSFAYDFAGGTGEPNDPYQIETAAQLLQIGSDPNLLNKCFILNNNIDLDPNVTGIPPFTQAPIYSFSGSFDGNDNIISSLIIDTNGLSTNYLGLFGRLLEDGIVKNLGIEDINITCGVDSLYIGGLCGQNYDGTITNCFSAVSITGGENLSGLCGWNVGGIITNCFSTGSVNGGGKVGGLCGYNGGGTIVNCFSTVSVTAGAESGWLGGLCGSNVVGTITNCFSIGSVTGYDSSHYIGGLCGHNVAGTITNCFSTGSVTAGVEAALIGGLCGDNAGTITNCFSKGSVTCGDNSYAIGGLCGFNKMMVSDMSFCYSTGLVTAGSNSQEVGGLIGDCEWPAWYSYFLDTAGPDNGCGATPLTDAQMKQQASFVDWDFVNETDNGTEDIWTIKQGVKYPEHVWPLVQYHSWDGVDFADYSFFSNHWLLTDCNDVSDCNSTDLDFSGSVDNNDLDIFTTYWLFAK